METRPAIHRLYLVRGGLAWHQDNRIKLPLRKGFLYLFPTQKPYVQTHDPKHPLAVTFFDFQVSPFMILDRVLQLRVDKSPAIAALACALRAAVEEKGGEKGRQKEEMVSRLLACLLHLAGLEAGLQYLREARLEKVREHMHKYYPDKLTNAQLAALVGMDHFHLIRLFNKTLGVSPQQYLADYRVSQACRLLREGESVKETAEKVGFEDAKAFSRSFRKSLGSSPSEYIRAQFQLP